MWGQYRGKIRNTRGQGRIEIPGRHVCARSNISVSSDLKVLRAREQHDVVLWLIAPDNGCSDDSGIVSGSSSYRRLEVGFSVGALIILDSWSGTVSSMT